MTKLHFFARFATALAVPALCGVALAQDLATAPAIGYKDTFQTNYTNSFVPSLGLVTITNGGSNTLTSLTLFGEPPIGSADICASIYNFKPDGTFINCCSCKVPANGLITLTGNNLFSPSAGSVAASGALVKLMASVAPAAPGVCSATQVPQGTTGPGGFAAGMGATAIHSLGFTETPFLQQPLGSNEVNKIVNLCRASAARCSCANPQ